MGSNWRKAKEALGFRSIPSKGADDEGDLSTPDSPLSTTSSSQSQSQSQSQNTCSICLSALEPGKGHAIFTAECSHSFHFHCISSNVKHGNQLCPVCRATWKNIPFQRVDPHPPLQSNPFTPSAHRFPPRSRRHFFTPSQATEPAVFDDDEPLGEPDHEQRTTSNLGAADSSTVKTIDITSYTELPCIQRNKSVEDFTVLIHLKAANKDSASSDSQSPRTPVDLVTVLDISGSMAGSKLALLKRAMGFVIHNLSSNDRLSVVVFSSTSRRLFPLLRMTESGRQKALLAVNSLMADGGTNIAEGLRKGAKVMEERRVKNAVAGIILLSDGQDTHTHYAQNGPGGTVFNYELFLPPSFLGNANTSRLRIPVHTFGFGIDHDASLLHSIAEMTGGTFSFIETNDAIQDSFAQCIGGLLSVVVQELQVELECIHPGIFITSITAGSYPTGAVGDGRFGYVEVGDLYAEEERDFLVSLNIPAETTLLLKVKYVHKDPVTKETVTWEGEEVKIERPETVVGEELVSIEVDRQRNRLQAAEAMGRASAAAEQGDLHRANDVVESYRKSLASTASAKVNDELSVALDAELKQMQDQLSSTRVYKSTGRAYIFSGMSSHSTQRANTRGSFFDMASPAQAYQTPAMKAMVFSSRTSSKDNA